MSNRQIVITRRKLIRSLSAGLVGTTVVSSARRTFGRLTPAFPALPETTVPLKIAHRAASMQMTGQLEVFRTVRQIKGLAGVELQISQGSPNFRDWDTVKRFKAEADRWGVHVPSLAGVWDRGVSLMSSPLSGVNLLESIRAAELIGARVILVAFFRDNAPSMADESSYGPVVELLTRIALRAADAGVILGLENSLSPSDNRKLIDLIDHPNIRVYYDPHNMAYYGHQAEAVPGIKLLGRERICQVHVKNGDKLLEEPGPIDWKQAIQVLNEIRYDGWYVFESQHSDRQDLLESTRRNVEFLRSQVRMPKV